MILRSFIYVKLVEQRDGSVVAGDRRWVRMIEKFKLYTYGDREKILKFAKFTRKTSLNIIHTSITPPPFKTKTSWQVFIIYQSLCQVLHMKLILTNSSISGIKESMMYGYLKKIWPRNLYLIKALYSKFIRVNTEAHHFWAMKFIHSNPYRKCNRAICKYSSVVYSGLLLVVHNKILYMMLTVKNMKAHLIPHYGTCWIILLFLRAPKATTASELS